MWMQSLLVSHKNCSLHWIFPKCINIVLVNCCSMLEFDSHNIVQMFSFQWLLAFVLIWLIRLKPLSQSVLRSLKYSTNILKEIQFFELHLLKSVVNSISKILYCTCLYFLTDINLKSAYCFCGSFTMMSCALLSTELEYAAKISNCFPLKITPLNFE